MLYIPLKKKKVISCHGIVRCCLVGLVIYMLSCLFILIEDSVNTWRKNDENNSKRSIAIIGENNNLNRKLFENKFTIDHNGKKMTGDELGFRLNEPNNAEAKEVFVDRLQRIHPDSVAKGVMVPRLQGIHPYSNVVMESDNAKTRKSRARSAGVVKPAGPTCQPVKLSERKLPLVALATSPGSGTTWARHLFQQVTGIYSSTTYHEPEMSSEEFPYERLYNGSAIPIKTHKRENLAIKHQVKFDKAVLIIRDPFEGVKAEFNRVSAGNTKAVTKDEFDNKRWLFLLEGYTVRWLEQTVSWLISRRPVFVIEYDALKHNLINTMREAVKFLDLTTTEEVLQCTQKNSEGGFHRAKKDNQSDLFIFPERSIQLLYEYKNITQWYLERRCPQLPWCLERSEVKFEDPPYLLTPREKTFKPKKTW